MLSRLIITGDIDLDTPLCIISEIADAHGINYDIDDFDIQELIKIINENNVKHIKFPIVGINDWGFLARFINKNATWQQNLLAKAYGYLSSFMYSEEKLINRLPEDFVIGVQTLKNIYSINPCILYKICKENKVYINHKTTVEQLGQAVNYLRMSKSTLLNKSLALLCRSSTTDVINFLMLNNTNSVNNTTIVNYHYLPNTSTSYEKLSKLENTVNNIKELQSIVIPKTDDGCIVLAAINYYIDISKSQCPIEEYIELKHKGLNYKPIDKWLRYWFDKNPNLFDLKRTFNPLFSQGLYNQNQLLELIKYEGYINYKGTMLSRSYEILQLAYVSETFYLGLLPLTKNEMTIVDLDNLSDIPYGQLLSYGQIDVSLNAITISELIDLFTANNNFTSPFGPGKVFSSLSINKLKNILSYPHGPIVHIKINDETLFIRKKLYNLISEIQLINNDEASQRFSSLYRNSNHSNKESIKNLLNIILELGMNMRGWLGEGDYPLKEQNASNTVDNNPTVALRVTDSMRIYKRERDKLGEIGLEIDRLPLVRYRDGEYQLSTSSLDGYTIGERIKIAKKGVDNPSMYSCVRMSSNWICSSAHKYLLILGLPSPFDIFKLEHIT